MAVTGGRSAAASPLVVIAVLLAGCGIAVGSGDAAHGQQRSVFALDRGMCFDEPDDVDEGLVASVEIVDCARPHDHEVFERFELAVGGDDGFPGVERVQSEAAERCGRAFEDFVGLPYSASGYFARFIVPTEASWSSRDRVVVCTLHLDGERKTGSARDAGR